MPDGLILAAVALSVAAALVRSRLRAWWLLLVLLLPVAAVLARDDWRVFSHHGFMHASIVYEIRGHGLPPENPLLAGQPLRYPFLHHAILAGIVRWLPVSPAALFAATNLLCLVLTALVAARTALLLRGDRAYQALAVFLAFAGCAPLARGPLAELLGAPLGLAAEPRQIPLNKFLTVGSNQIGLLLFALILYALALLIVRDSERRPALHLLAVALIGAGLLYPPAWLGGAIFLSGAAAPAFLRRGGARSFAPRAVAPWLLAIPAATSVLLYPWLAYLAGGRGPEAAPGPLLAAGHLARNAGIAIPFLAAAGLCLWLGRDGLAGSGRERSVLGLFAAGAGALLLGFLVLHFTLDSEYKLLAMSQVAVAPVVAAALRPLWARRRAVAAALTLALALPAAASLERKMVRGWPVEGPVRVAGGALRHGDPAERALHDWILARSAPEAVFVDTRLDLPVFAQRRLLVGYPRRRTGAARGRPHNGWDLSGRMVATRIFGAPMPIFRRRRALADRLLGLEMSGVDPEVATAALSEVPGRPVYVVIRPGGEPRWEQPNGSSPRGADLVFHGPAARVYRLAEPGQPR